MKITDIDIWTVVVPAVPERVNSPEYGPAGWDTVSKHIFKLRTDEGAEGLAETGRGVPVDAVRQGFELLEGGDPMDLSLQHVYTDVPKHRVASTGTREWEGMGGWLAGRAYDAFEMAVYDIVGPMHQFVLNAAIADAARLPIWHGSGCDLGIIETSSLHAASVARNCVLPGDFVGGWVRENDLIVTPLDISRGEARAPCRPGLGCELDMDALVRYRIS